jgi:hypothetical protein
MAAPKKPAARPPTFTGKSGGPVARKFGSTGKAVLVPAPKPGYRTYEDGSQAKKTPASEARYKAMSAAARAPKKERPYGPDESPNLGGRNLTSARYPTGTAKGGKAYGNARADVTRAKPRGK